MQTNARELTKSTTNGTPDRVMSLQVHPLSGGDPHGLVFTGEGRVVRGVTAEAQTETRELFERGVIKELVKRRLIPKTSISGRVLPGFPLVLEQEFLPGLTYSYEWTFNMLRDAGGLVLTLRDVLNGYGYDLKDAHPDNITFSGATPLWMDIGSFTRSRDVRLWTAELRYRESFLYLLRMWSRFGEVVGRRILVGSDYIAFESAILVTHPWARVLGAKMLKKIARMRDIYMSLDGIALERFREKVSRMPRVAGFLRRHPLLEAGCRSVSASRRLPYRRTVMARLRRDLHAIRGPRLGSKWKEYHSNVLREVGSAEEYPRFQKVLDILNELQPASVTEIGANQGLLSRQIWERLHPERVVAIDIDGNALDLFYLANRKAGRNIYHAVLDVNRPVLQVPKVPPEERLRSEAVVALAVTHHMILAQCSSAEYTLRRIASFTEKWLLVEYMPYGLYAKPVVYKPPAAYSVDTFEAAFRSVAGIMGVYELEPTRILYVGRRKSARKEDEQ